MTMLPRSGALPSSHLIPDLLEPGLKLVFCGTALGRKSAEARAYYANPTNLFWRALHEVGLTPERLRSADYPRLLEHGIGLTDLSKRHFGNDAELPDGAFDRSALREKMVLHLGRRSLPSRARPARGRFWIGPLVRSCSVSRPSGSERRAYSCCRRHPDRQGATGT